MAVMRSLLVKHVVGTAVVLIVLTLLVLQLVPTPEKHQPPAPAASERMKRHANPDRLYTERRRDIARTCHLYPSLNRPFTVETVNKMIVDPIHRIMFCPAGKAASTFWKQILEISSGIFNATNPLEVYDEDYKQLYYLSNLNSIPQKVAINCFKSFFFTRHPLSRIYSAYNDKLFMSNYYYWGAWGTKIIQKFRQGANEKSIKCGHDVTFAEFVKFLLFIYETNHPASTDTHISPITSQCKPCSVNYTYIGKLETLTEDTHALLQVLGVANKIVFRDLKDQYERQSIADLVHRNLNWHKRYPKINTCISQTDLIHRIWAYSQNVGHIDFVRKPPSRLLGRSDVTVAEMTDALMASRPLPAVKKQVKEYKKLAMKKAYSTIPADDMEKLISIYRLDFEMFGYEPVA